MLHQNALPENVHLVSLIRTDNDTVILRLGHRFGIEEGPLSTNVDIDLNNIFQIWDVVSAQETSLTANQLKRDMLAKRLWVTQDDPRQAVLEWNISSSITLRPMEIRTFAMKIRAR